MTRLYAATGDVAELEFAPDRLAERLVASLIEPDAVAAVRAMTRLAAETLARVPDDLDVAAARRGIDARLASL
ncbi:MAG TPA: hypothetical protein VML35_05085 [Gaiellaceae bacterium]|nr:hypothetical protein [Gaiellaceae bacterium]